MSFISTISNQLSKAVQRATAAGDTRAVNKLTKMIDTPDPVANRLKQIEAKKAEYKNDYEMDVDTYVHRTRSQGDIDMDNFQYRAGSTPAAAGKGKGIFTAPVGYADDTIAYGPREFGVITDRTQAPKIGQGRHTLAEGTPELPETFIPENQVEEIFEIKPAVPTLTSIGDDVVGGISNFTNNFKGNIEEMRSTSAIKKLFKGKDLSDRNIAGFATDALKIIDENSAGSFKKINGEKIYERLSLQDMTDKLGRRLEARMMNSGDNRLTSQERRELGSTILTYARGNMGKFIKEDMLKTARSSKLHISTSPAYKEWSKAGGRTLMKAFDNVTEARNPSTKKSHGLWKSDETGNILEAPHGSTKEDLFAGGSKAELTKSTYPSLMKSLNVLGSHKTGMDKDYFGIWKNLGKKGFFNETAGPSKAFKDDLDMTRLTAKEFDELGEAFDLIGVKGNEQFGPKLTAGQFMKIKEEVFTPRLKALETIAKGTKRSMNQRIAKQSATRRITDELDRRFAADKEGGAFFQYNIDTRGRAYPIDPSGASINSGGAIRHGFTSSQRKPIYYNDHGYKQIVDDVVLFDNTSNLSKIQGSGLDRHKHYVKNESRYLKQGQDALDNIDNSDWNPSWLKSQKDKGPYLRGVMELARVKNASKKGLPYESNMLIEVDAPSSGSQHIGAQYGDEGILWQTSVLTKPEGSKGVLNADDIASLKAGVPDDSVARDLYTDVGVIYSKNVEQGYLDLAAKDPKKAEAFKFFSDKYLSSGRGIVKPIVMKVPYGAGDNSLRKDLVNQLSGRQQLEMADAGINAEDLMDFHWDSMKGALKTGLKTQYNFKKFNKVLGKIYKDATNRKPFTVEGPDGGVTDFTRYVMKPKRTFKAEITSNRLPDFNDTANKEVQVYSSKPVAEKGLGGVEGFKIDTQEIAQGLAPNVTHSLDAAYLHKLVKAANDEGIELRVVHDAFFTGPNDIEAVKKLAGKVFKEMHAGYNLRTKMIEGLSKATGESVESILDKVRGAGLDMTRKFEVGDQPTSMFGNVIRGG